MSSFTTPLIIEEDWAGNPKRPWRIHERFSFYSDYLPFPVEVEVGYRTDFASIPRFFWRIFPPYGRYGKAAVVHDWLCSGINPRCCDYLTAADVFDEAMQVLGVCSTTRRIMVGAVKAFGPRFKYGDPL